MTDAIRIEGLTKRFGRKTAVSDLSLTIPTGRVTGFIGPNGAGKTTTIRMIMSILFPDAGTLEVLGKRSAVESKDSIGYLPEERGVYRKMRVRAFLRHIASLKGAQGDIDAKVTAWLERVGLADVGKKKCEELSKGMQQKIQFISSVLHEPELLILDEPFSGLDPVNMRLLRDLIREQHERGTTIIFSTHVMFQAEQLCDHIVMIHDGRKMLDDSLKDIRASHDPRSVVYEPLDGEDPDAIAAGVREIEGVASVGKTNDVWEARLSDGTEARTVMREVVGRAPVSRVEVRKAELEDIFISIVSGGASEGVDEQALRASLRAGAAGSDDAGEDA